MNRAHPIRAVLLASAVLLTAVTAGSGPLASADPVDPAANVGSGEPETPTITPTPQRMTPQDENVTIPRTVSVVVDPEVDQPTRELLVKTFRGEGAENVTITEPNTRTDAELTVRVGNLTSPDVAKRLREAGVEVPKLPAEGYALAASGKTLVLGGVDPTGTYYAAQTLRQLAGDGHISGAHIVDHPSMPLRGTIEGFYGSPWTHKERMDQLRFYGDVKLNTYIYAPKDDPYHREKWREPYPQEKLNELGELINEADANHVRFTFALSPGMSMCYSSKQDQKALNAKLQSMYDLGVRSFSLPLDDIDYTKWHCAADREKYGEPSPKAAGQAQVDLLNRVQRQFIDNHPGTRALQSVPTEYSDTEDSPYKRTIREQLDDRVEMMWTGVGVIPHEITVEQAKQAAKVWGRKVFVWDNYPVNDFDETAGRLLLAPYAKREAGLHKQLSGIVLNPMNQASASKVAEFTAADYVWNDTAYDPRRSHRQAARYLAGGDKATTEALLTFFDLQHLAPTSTTPWQPQAPKLAGEIDQFRKAWKSGDKRAAIGALRGDADRIAAAPGRITEGVVDPAFSADAKPWLEATTLWGDAFVTTMDGLRARVDGDDQQASRKFDEAAELMKRASAIRTIPGETRPEGPVKVGDGVLDTFLREAPTLR